MPTTVNPQSLDPERAYNLAKILNKRDSRLEKIIATSPGWSYWYARDVIGDKNFFSKQRQSQLVIGQRDEL